MCVNRLFGVALVCIAAGCTDSTPVWVQGDGFRFRELSVRGRSRSGFTEVSPQNSGMTAQNQVSSDAIVENRHMMHGSGVAIGDVTGDGLPDVYIARLAAPDVLYRNLGNWKFEDISIAAGLDRTATSTSGVVMADLDGDRDLDLLLTMPFGPGAIYLNTGRGVFERSPDVSGLRSFYAGTTATLADVDQDGDLDVYVARYKRIALADSLPPENITWDAVLQEGQLVPRQEFRTHYRFRKMGSRVLRSELAEPDGLYLNDGHGYFSEVPWLGGAFLDGNGKPLRSIPRGWALTAKFYDVTGDHIPDLYVCNDYDSVDELWIGLGDGRFRRAPARALRKTSNATMSVDFSDVNRDGIVDFFTTDMLSRDYSRRQRQRNTRIPLDDVYRPQEMQNALMIGRGDTTFAELAWFSQIAASDWSWATAFMDIDLDGWEDILITTGHVYDVQDLDAQRVEQSRRQVVPSWKAVRRLILDFPPLALNNVAFRNRGNLTFEDMPHGWGFGQQADIAHGMAMGDLDADGDLDIVTNRFNAPPGVYRNTGTEARLSVMLEGTSPNTSGIGAEIRVFCVDLPEQTRQMSSGGSYLSANQHIAVFAVSSPPCRVEVVWPSGQRSVIPAAQGNRLYVIQESGAVDISGMPLAHQELPMYELDQIILGATGRHEFDDFAVQPMLPWRLSRRGPALAAAPVHGGGRYELFQGRSLIPDSLHGDMAGVLVVSLGNGRTRIMVGEARYEYVSDSSWIHIYDIESDTEEVQHQKLPFGRAAPGPLSVADIDQDGDLDLFAGGHFIPGRYPISADSRIYLHEKDSYRFSTELSAPLRKLGRINGSVFGDLNEDGYTDLVLATEWGPVQVLVGSSKGFTDRTESLGLAPYRGWWRGVALGDFDGDGALDIVASNAGWNHRYGRSTRVRLLYGDFHANGRVSMLEAFQDPETQTYRPSRMLTDLMPILVPTQMRISSHREFSTARVQELLPPSVGSVQTLETTTYASGIFLNRGERFEYLPLHPIAQHSAGISPAVLDANMDGNEDIVLSQNWFAYPISTPRQDAGRGLLLLGKGDGTFRPADRSGLEVYGEGRAVSVGDFDGDDRDDIAFAQYGGPVLVYRRKSGPKGISIQFHDTVEAVGTVLRVVYSDNSRGAARIVTAGSGYWSQNALAANLGLREGKPVAIEVIWPGQASTRVRLLPGKWVYYLKR